MQFRHAKERRDDRALRYEGWKLGISVLLFWVVSSIIPVYNKVVFDGLAGDNGFPFPITTAFLQLLFCAVVLTITNVAAHLWRVLNFYQTSMENNCSAEVQNMLLEEGQADEEDIQRIRSQYLMRRVKTVDDSWIFGPHLWFKVRLTLPIGALFGLKYGVTNWGLHLLPIAPHLLLQATDLAWTVLFARILAHEHLTGPELATCGISTLGTFLVAYRTHQVLPDSLYAVAVNLVSPVLLGLCVTTLRLATYRLLVQEAGPNGRTKNMTPFELSAIKLWISSATILPFALIFENYGFDLFGWKIFPPSEPGAFQIALHTSPALGLASLGGGVFVLIFQVNMTWLSKMATAVTVGMVGGMKIVPQWLTAVAFSQSIDLSILNVAGAGALLISSLAWTYLRYDPSLTDTTPKYQNKNYHRRKSRGRFRGYSTQSSTRTSSPGRSPAHGSSGASSHSSNENFPMLPRHTESSPPNYGSGSKHHNSSH